MDWRTTPANGRVAAIWLKGKIASERFVAGELRRVIRPLAPILREPAAVRTERELLFGDDFLALDVAGGFAFGRSARDGYCGYVPAEALGPAEDTVTHAVAARSTHVYSGPDIKSSRIAALPFGARLSVGATGGALAELTGGGFVPAQHLRAIDAVLDDPVAVALTFLGTPYLWGGNSSFGLDCSGLVQAALLACGLPCPGDSDLQEQALGHPLAPHEPTQRGDLYFWKGHVAMATDGDTIIHANGHTMTVALEPIATAIARIEAAGDGPVTSRRRL